jgi:hypothetical protein
MAATTPTSLPDLPKGHRFPETTFQITRQDVEGYLRAVDDRQSVYLEMGLAPPLGVAARALSALLDVVELPGGSLHTGQEVEAQAGVPIGAELIMTGRIAQRSERSGLIISVLEFSVTVTGESSPAVSGRTTVMAAASASSKAPGKAPGGPA